MTPTQKVSSILTEAANLLETKFGLSKESFARDAKGHSARVDSQYATSFCAFGIVSKVGRDNYALTASFLAKFVASKEGATVVQWNDRPQTKKEDVVLMLREAAKEAEREGL